ncbi:RNA ligase family protein [Bacillus sp. B1-b2]|uniref:ATP-dependent DNA ligase n=1 Tax=Bacillus sp. B1-b2 TaxID=2653201 RepID=UPI001261815A|nr:RNA ligase family protein [Bacillus sp. B1-b2]KAB7673053.1 DNA ligase [Bacillus sp. B1-b2]
MNPIKPFEPIVTENIPTGDNWIGQVKWDGTRILVYNDGTKRELYNRKLNNRSKQYPEILQLDTYFHGENCILDGEVISLRNGKPSFYDVMKRDRKKNIENISVLMEQVPITYMIFDILYLNNSWLVDLPLRERQHLLKKVISPTEHIQLVENFIDKEALFQVCMQNDLEGVIFKDLDSTYKISGKDGKWKKKKKEMDLMAVVGGVSYRDNIVNSLHLGLYDDKGELVYIGSAGSGKLTAKDWRDITKVITSIVISQAPFNRLPDVKGANWIRPALTVKISFLEWTDANTLRHPVIESFVNMPIHDCVFPD